MPDGREGKLAEQFCFAPPPMNFHGAGGQGGAGFGGSLRSAEALLVYAGQRVGRASILNINFSPAYFPFPWPGGGVFGGSLQPAAALLVDSCHWDGRGSALHHFHLCFRR